jgi:ABC-type multidrug transport system ATPase subunit
MADRVGVISRGELILVEEKNALMQKLGKKELTLSLAEPLAAVPPELEEWDVTLEADGTELHYIFDATAERTGVPSLLRRMSDLGIGFKDLSTSKARWRTSSSASSPRGKRHELARHRRDLPVRDAPVQAHPVDRPRRAP